MKKIKPGDVIRINTKRENRLHLNGKEFIVEYVHMGEYFMENEGFRWHREDFDFVKSESCVSIRKHNQSSYKISTISEAIKRLEKEWNECNSKQCVRTKLSLPNVPEDMYDYVKGIVYYDDEYEVNIFFAIEGE